MDVPGQYQLVLYGQPGQHVGHAGGLQRQRSLYVLELYAHSWVPQLWVQAQVKLRQEQTQQVGAVEPLLAAVGARLAVAVADQPGRLLEHQGAMAGGHG